MGERWAGSPGTPSLRLLTSRPHRPQFLGLRESSVAEEEHECEWKASWAAPEPSRGFRDLRGAPGVLGTWGGRFGTQTGWGKPRWEVG